ncbi:MAG TPA: phytanoyl-CoA dioxygenase family protein [Acidimicrobiales bacterium]|nr:phytanoyl-CoA dioxygenase family protein [Acidimicrobiales bacterium]
MTSEAPNSLLSREEVEDYRDKGYLLYRDQLLSDKELDELAAIYDEHRAARPDKRGDEFDTPHFEDQRLMAFLLAPPVLDLVECVLGPSFLLWSSHFICKEPRVGRATPWHRDADYWSGRADRYDQIVTVWLALDDVDRANGCMQVIPRSHLMTDFAGYRPVDRDTNTFSSEIVDLDTSTAVAFELRRGQCSLHDARMAHGAEPNSSPRRRLGYTMRYISTETTLVPERNVGHRTWVARSGAPRTEEG